MKGVEWAGAISTDPRATVSQAKSAVLEALSDNSYLALPEPEILPPAKQGDSFRFTTVKRDYESDDPIEYITLEEAKEYAEWRVQQVLKAQQLAGQTFLPKG